jgi:nucleoside permease NupC
VAKTVKVSHNFHLLIDVLTYYKYLAIFFLSIGNSLNKVTRCFRLYDFAVVGETLVDKGALVLPKCHDLPGLDEDRNYQDLPGLLV